MHIYTYKLVNIKAFCLLADKAINWQLMELLKSGFKASERLI